MQHFMFRTSWISRSPTQSHQGWRKVGSLLQKFAKVKKNPIDASCNAGLAADCNSSQVFIEEVQKAGLTAYETKRLSKHLLGWKIIVNSTLKAKQTPLIISELVCGQRFSGKPLREWTGPDNGVKLQRSMHLPARKQRDCTGP